MHAATKTRRSGRAVPTERSALKLAHLPHRARGTCERMKSGMIRRHDFAGHLFHRLLDSRKFHGDQLHNPPGGGPAGRPHPRRTWPALVGNRLRFGRVRGRAADRGSGLRTGTPPMAAAQVGRPGVHAARSTNSNLGSILGKRGRHGSTRTVGSTTAGTLAQSVGGSAHDPTRCRGGVEQFSGIR